MKRFALGALPAALLLIAGVRLAPGVPAAEFHDLFNGKDLTGWVNVNTDKDTWSVKNGLLFCTGHPIGVMRSAKQYENFVLHIEWMHMEPGGNSGVFVWSNAKPNEQSRLPNGVEVQMLELDWVNLNKQNGEPAPIAYVHGELFGVGGVVTDPDNPRGDRSKSVENRCKGRGEWNVYDVVCVDGVIKLSVNGKFVNGVRRSTQKKGYLCLESEGAEIHFRNIRILELPPGVTTAEQTAAEVK
jgi:3-keto-disaccharide hydrolase